MQFATKAVHVGQEPDPINGAIIPPVYMTSTYVQNAPGELKQGYDYTRANNPNFMMLEAMLSSLESAEYATIFSSGLGALTAMVMTLSPGDKVLAVDGVYGGTFRLFTKVFKRFGIEYETFNPANIEQIDKKLATGPKWLFFETPTNPLLEILDIEALTALAKKHGVMTIVDNTFATPYFQQPFQYGVDIVWHSTTKYIGGHSDIIGGVAMTNDPELKQALDFNRMAIGLNPSPFDAWLTTRSVKTLAIRMQKHEENAKAIADYFESHPLVKKVYYPGLKSHPSHEIARKQMKGFGGMISIEFDFSLEQTMKLISGFKYFALAESLGGVESLVNHPSTMTHASIPADERQRIGIADGLVRFSVGIEAKEDLLGDLDQTINKIII